MVETQRQDVVKRRRTTTSAILTSVRPCRWADLPADVLLSVAYAASYPSALRYANVGHVCRGWCAVIVSALSPGPFPCRLPMLALPPVPVTSGLENITSFPEDWGHVPFGIPTVVQTNIAGAVGSSHGWLIVLDLDARYLSVRNPATGQAVRLPSLQPLLAGSSLAPPLSSDVHRVISHDSALRGDFVVLLFLVGVTTRCFTFRCGANDAWAAHAHCEFHVEDVLFFSGRFVAVDKENTLALFDWADDGGNRLVRTTRSLQPRMHHPRETSVSSFGSVFLVELNGSLLVATMWCQCSAIWSLRKPPPEVKSTGRSRRILKVDFSEDSGDGAVLTANERLDLGGHEVFLGYGNSVAVAGERFPALGTDVVFYPMITYTVFKNKRRTNGAIAISPYNLRLNGDSGTIIPVEFCEGRANWMDPPAGVWEWPARPLWVVPNLLRIVPGKKKVPYNCMTYC